MIEAGDTAFVLVSAALVLLMTPGLALFYGGMVRGKNVLGTFMQSFFLISLISFEWVILGYSMSFGPDAGGMTGTLAWALLSGVGAAPNPDYAATIPHTVFMIYQCMFAVITPALITGAFAERVRFAPFLVFSLLWAVLVYNPVCHWVWGAGGWLKTMFLGEAPEDWRAVRDLVKTVASNYRIPYYTVSPTYSVCPVHGYLAGEQWHCPKCKAEKEAKLRAEIAKVERELAEAN